MIRNPARTMALAILCAPAHASDLDSALSKLENWKAADTAAPLFGLMETIRSDAPVGDKQVWERLQRVMRDEKIAPEGRSAALLLACEKADAEIASDILTVVAGWAHTACDSDGIGSRERYLIAEFLKDGLGHVERVVVDQDPIIDLLEELLTRHTLGSIGRGASVLLKSLAESPAPIARRQKIALEYIRKNHKRSEQLSEPVLSLIDERAFPQLRGLVRQSADPGTFHLGAAAALAHHGDTEILPDLESRRPAFLQRHRNTEGTLIWFIWQINMQHPASRLLEYITSDTPAVQSTGRIWCVIRAVQVGLPKDDIRKAILTFAATVQPNERGDRIGLHGIKQVALRLGVLKPGDLPDVRLDPTSDH